MFGYHSSRILLLLLLLLLRRRKIQQNATIVRRFYRHPVFESRRAGYFFNMHRKLWEHSDLFRKFYRMEPDRFEELVSRIRPILQPMVTTRKKSRVSIDEMVALTVCYLPHGLGMDKLAIYWCIPPSTVCILIHKTLQAMWLALQPEFMPTPTSDILRSSAEGFKNRWNMPNCVGAVDGKHILITKSRLSGTNCFNYKRTFSVVLMAVTDWAYKFIYIDVGAFGGASDGGVFKNCDFVKGIESGDLTFPTPCTLPGSDILMPHYIIGDAAFPLKPWLMKPYAAANEFDESSLIFNYRLSRARRMVESSFGILAARFRIFHVPIIGSYKLLNEIVKGACVLHNFLMSGSVDQAYCYPGLRDYEINGVQQNGAWRKVCEKDTNMLPLNKLRTGRNKNRLDYTSATDLRNNLRQYFLSVPGQVPWQFNMIRRGRIQN